MVAPLEPNRIHSLPVQVSYHLQSSSQTFSTIFSAPQQVYVHPNAGSKVDGHDEAWGAIYLKTVVQGIMMASPELHPKHPGTPDLSLYVLDPRETYLRRSRGPASSHARSSPIRTPPEVWTGKGLVSWALDEPAQGKNLITGRIVRRAEFANVAEAPEGMSALEALAAANSASDGSGEAWGIEISLGLKSGITSSISHSLPPLHHAVENGAVAAQAGFLGTPPRLPPSSSPCHPAAGQPRRLVSDPRPVQRAPSIGIPRITTPARTFTAPQSSSSASSSRINMPPSSLPPSSLPRGVTRKRGADDVDRTLSSLDMNRRVHPSSTPTRGDAGLILPNPENMTREQAKELLKNGTFLQMLEQITGAPLASMAAERAKEEEEEQQVTKRARFDSKDSGAELRCSNCSTTRSSVWRTKKSEDGSDNVRVCNACGLWYNKTRTMRPKEFWTTGDEEPVRRGRAAKARKDAAAAAQQERPLKRTLTQVVEKDAKRIAEMRKPPAPRATAPRTTAPRGRAAKAVPMTSPSASAPVPKPAVRNAKFAASTTVAASSPGGWAQPLAAAPSTPAATPIDPPSCAPAESPNTAFRRIMNYNSMPSLAMPLSDDGPSATPAAVPWNADLTAFFDIDGFAMPPGAAAAPMSSAAPRDSELNAASSVLRHPAPYPHAHPLTDAAVPATSEDDVFSQLFQRTSSMGADLDLGSSHSQFGSSAFDRDPSPSLTATSSTSTWGEKFDHSKLPPSSPPSLPSCLPHSALLLSSPSGSPHTTTPTDYSPAEGKVSPARSAGSGLKNEIGGSAGSCSASVASTPMTASTPGEHDQAFQDLLSKFGGNNDELLALFNSFPAAA